MKLSILFTSAAMLLAGTALASDKSYFGTLQPSESVFKSVTLHKGTTDIQIIPDHENRVTCEFIDVKAGNVVVLREEKNQVCNGTSINESDVVMAVKITNPNDGLLNFEMKVSPRK